MNIRIKYISVAIAFLCLCGCASSHDSASLVRVIQDSTSGKQWLAGDHHVHSKYSMRWDHSQEPPTPIYFGDAHYPAAINARMAADHGLSWMVITDHGGPNHSQINRDEAYPELLIARQAVPELLLYHGLEFDVPAGRHNTLIIPRHEAEADQLHELESRFNRRETFPGDFSRDDPNLMIEAMETMQAMTPRPVMFVNHPARQAAALGEFTRVTPDRMRAWQDAGPDVLRGMTAIPGHHAASLNPDGSLKEDGLRAEYFAYPTHGGADQMSAVVGGVWDSLLGEGRPWTVTAVSDSHAHYTEGRTDFWPGEYAKTYVYAERNYDSVLDGLRYGNVFITTGDLIDALYVYIEQGQESASIGQTITLEKADTATVTIAFRIPENDNFRGQRPLVERVDIILGQIDPQANHSVANQNPNTEVIRRFTPNQWKTVDGFQLIKFQLPTLSAPGYLRVRGTNRGNELEPEVDYVGEDPWADLWFYSNPVYIEVERQK